LSAPLRTIHVGVGGRGHWPVEVLSDDPRFQPVALVDVVPGNLAAARERSRLPESACFTDVDVALAAVPAAALVICTPATLHASFCREGFAAGKAVLVEKGMTRDWGEACGLVRVAREAGVCFCVSQNYRYMQEVQTLQQALASGRYGAPHLIDLIHHRHRPEPRTLDYPGAVVWDMSCHHFDNLVYLFGPVARATAVTHTAPCSPSARGAAVGAFVGSASGRVCTCETTHRGPLTASRGVRQRGGGGLGPGGAGWEWLLGGELRRFAPPGPPEPVEPVPLRRS